MPVFLDDGKRLGIGRGRRIVSQVLGWLRAGNDHLALVTNGRQWRLLFAGLDYDAWCEWDLDLWFDEGELSPQVEALRTLLNAELWTPETEDSTPRLLQAIRDTRKGQAELSEVLGERVREAVEILIRGHGEALRALVESPEIDNAEYRQFLADDAGVSSAEVPPDDDEPPPVAVPTAADIYRAACRVAMRLVVILFAESRDLLPRDNALYHGSYGLNGLLEQLNRNEGSLGDGFGAWPRVLALFRLVWEGSHHPGLPVTAYGGELFAAGEPDSADGVSQALAVFERACFEKQVLPDRDVRDMLARLTRTTVRIRQGRSGVRATVPVDFSDLSSEYLGILYEGLLDYELKTAPAGDPVVFLSVGDQPALPLSRLEAMDDAALKALFESFKKNKPTEQDDDSEEEREEDEPVFDTEETDATAEDAGSQSDERRHDRTRAETWARRAAQVAGLVRKRRGRQTPERRLADEQELAETARRLVARVVLPRRVVPGALGRHTQGLRQLLHPPRPCHTHRAPHLASTRLRPADRCRRHTGHRRTRAALDPEAPRGNPQRHGLRPRLRLRHLPAGRTALSHRCAVRRAAAPSPHRTGRRAFPGPATRHPRRGRPPGRAPGRRTDPLPTGRLRLRASPQGGVTPPRGRALHLRRRRRSARRRAVPAVALDRDHGPGAAIRLPGPQGQVRQRAHRRVV